MVITANHKSRNFAETGNYYVSSNGVGELNSSFSFLVAFGPQFFGKTKSSSAKIFQHSCLYAKDQLTFIKKLQKADESRDIHDRAERDAFLMKKKRPDMDPEELEKIKERQAMNNSAIGS